MQIRVCVFEVSVDMYTSQENVERWQWKCKSALERKQHVRGSGGRSVGGVGGGETTG